MFGMAALRQKVIRLVNANQANTDPWRDQASAIRPSYIPLSDQPFVPLLSARGPRSCLPDKRRFRGHALWCQGGQNGRDHERTTLTPCPRLRSCGRSRKPAPGAYRQARQAGGVFRRKIAHHRFCPLQRGELRNSPDRGCNPIQGSQPDQASANGLELLSSGAEREFRYPAGEPARLGDELVPRNG